MAASSSDTRPSVYDASRSRMGSIFGLALFVAFVLVMANILLGNPVGKYRRRHWAHASGRVVGEPAVQRMEGADRDDPDYFHLDQQYEFTVAGQAYRGWLRRNFAQAAEADAFLASLRNAGIAVQYDPRDPSRSRVDS